MPMNIGPNGLVRQVYNCECIAIGWEKDYIPAIPLSQGRLRLPSIAARGPANGGEPRDKGRLRAFRRIHGSYGPGDRNAARGCPKGAPLLPTSSPVQFRRPRRNGARAPFLSGGNGREGNMPRGEPPARTRTAV